MIGILGGTFDPVHNGHLRIAIEALEGLRLDEVRLVPCRTPVHRDEPHATTEQRLQMLQLATAPIEGLTVDDRELRRETPSYTLLTLRDLREEVGEDESICLLLGGDSFNDFLSWRDPEGIMELAHLVVLQRPGYQLPEDSAIGQLAHLKRCDLVMDLETQPAGRIYFQPVSQLEISATDIRQRASKKHLLNGLVPDPVATFVRSWGIYQARDSDA